MTVARFLRIARQRLRSVLRKGALDTELDQELAFHVDQLVRERIAEGLTPIEARRAAQRTIGNIAAFEDACRDERRVTWFHDLLQDTAYGWRLLRTRTGFTSTAVAALAIGIGANAAMLSAIDTVRFGSLPFPDAARIVVIRTAPLNAPRQTSNATVLDYFSWQERSRVFASMGASLSWQADFNAEPKGAPAERLFGQTFTPSLFALLGVNAELGRVFTLADIQRGHPGPVVISHRLWQRRFGGDPNIINSPIRMDRGVRIVVGVMPESFRYQDQHMDFWIPLLMNPAQMDNPSRLFSVNARLAPGVTVAQARAEMAAIGEQLAREQPERSAGRGVRVDTLRDALYGWTIPPLVTLEGAAALLLLIAGANVAGLLLSRNTVRQRELAVRAALGAGRGRIRRQLLAESVLLAVGGGALSVPVTWVGFRELGAMMDPPIGSPPLAPIGLGVGVIALTIMLSVIAGLWVGLVPAMAGTPRHLMRALREPAPSTSRPTHQNRWRDVLVALQMAIAVVLLIGAGLLLSSFMRLKTRDLHFDADDLLTLEIHVSTPPAHAVGMDHGAPVFEFSPPPSLILQRVHDALRNLPGAESVAGISHPLFTTLVVPTAVVTLDRSPREQTKPPDTKYFLVTPDFFTTLKATLVRGRDLTDRDVASTPWVAIVNETAARLFWPGDDAIGQHLTLDGVLGERPREVVGVVADIPVWLRQIATIPVVYLSYLQQPIRTRGPLPGMFGQMMFVLRQPNDPMSVLQAARRAVASVAPELPLTNIGTVADVRSTPELRTYVIVLGAFAAAATWLAAIGVYGVMLQAVNLRTREIGVRRALGADTREVLALFGRRAVVPIGAGWALGVIVALPVTRLLSSQLWGVTPGDLATFAEVSCVAAIVAIVACVRPCWRAILVSPIAILKQE